MTTPTIAEQIAFVQQELEEWSEDVAMGGGTGVNALENLANDPALQRSCSMVEMYEAILESLERLARAMSP